MTPLVTIVTPTYDKPARFAECAAAVLAQSFTDWTWWVVFNPDYHQSLDESLGHYNAKSEVNLKLQREPRFVPILFPVQSRNRLAKHIPARIVNWLYPKITTPYIYFLADDDLIDPDGLGVLVSAAEPKIRAMRRDELGPFGGSGEVLEEGRYDAVYGRCEVQSEQPDGSFVTTAWCYPGPIKEGADISANISDISGYDVGLGTGVEPKCLLDGGQVLHTADLWRRATADGWQLTDSKDDASANDGTLLNRLAEFARFHYVPQRIVTHRRTYQSTFHKPQVSQ